MRHLISLKGAAAALAAVMGMAFTACDETSPATGGSLVTGEVEIVRDSTFTITGLPEATGAVRSSTILQLLGRYSAEGYGQFESDIVCQYMPAASLDTTGVTAERIDSVKLSLAMYRDGFAGDSVAPMGLAVYPLTKQLPSVMYSDFDPKGYYSETPIGQTSYSALIHQQPNVGADAEGAIYKNIEVKLPVEIGRSLFEKYLEDPKVFNNPSAFAQWFPGLYITNTFGSGRVTRISYNTINVYYHAVYQYTDTLDQLRDTVIPAVASYMGVTPEVMTNNNIRYTMAPSLRERAEKGEPLLVGPLGYDVEFKFPAADILSRYNASCGPLAVVNSLSLKIPATDISNDYGLTPPPYVLLIKKSQKEEFFAKGKINDNLSSFYAAYDAINGCYTFSSMVDYINEIIKKGSVDADDEEFVICPVQVSFFSNASSTNDYYYSYYYGYSYGSSSSSATVSSITPYVTEPVMTLLQLDKAEVVFSYTKQTL